MDAELLIRDVSDTALWAAVFRAKESARADALFHDPFAERLAGARGQRIFETVPHAADNSWAWVMRTYLLDRIISAQIAAGVDLVVNLAAGLDARPYRMNLPETLRWVEIDLPQIVTYKSEILAAEKPVCALERLAVNLADVDLRRQTLARVAEGSRRILAISEGLLIYLSPDEAGELARDLAAVPAIKLWAIDIPSPGLLRMLQQTTGEHTGRAGAPYRFGPAEGPAFFLPHGWTTVEANSVFRAAIETGRVPPELAAFAGFPEPEPPFSDDAIWSGICLLTH